MEKDKKTQREYDEGRAIAKSSFDYIMKFGRSPFSGGGEVPIISEAVAFSIRDSDPQINKRRIELIRSFIAEYDTPYYNGARDFLIQKMEKHLEQLALN